MSVERSSVERRLLVDRLVTGDGVVGDGYVMVRDGLIAELGRTSDLGDVDLDGGETLHGWLVPGFVDTHCHGGGGADFGSADRDDILQAVAFHRAHGTTTTYASLVSADPDRLVTQISRTRSARRAG